MFFDFFSALDTIPVILVSIQGMVVELVENYKYLGMQIDNKLDWNKNTEPSLFFEEAEVL